MENPSVSSSQRILNHVGQEVISSKNIVYQTHPEDVRVAISFKNLFSQSWRQGQSITRLLLMQECMLQQRALHLIADQIEAA